MAETISIHGGGGEGVLLYCKYAPVPDVSALVRLYESNCLPLGLRGRVWIGRDGVHVTVRGELSSLENHIAAMRSRGLFEGTDFKLVSCDALADEEIARKYGFAFLSVRVVKLFDGVQRYLEQFPDGGLFKGKSFVFDHRITVGSQDAMVTGSCLKCGTFFNDYSAGRCCRHCRILVLVCNSCQGKSSECVCELCLNFCKEGDSNSLMGDGQFHSELSSTLFGEVRSPILYVRTRPTPSLEFLDENGTRPQKKLRILCLHGFRQNSSGFKGRMASLAKKLKKIADLIFVDAPHELPFVYHPQFIDQSSNSVDPSRMEVAVNSARQPPPPPCHSCKKKFAWLVSPTPSCEQGTDWKVADQPFDPLQYQQQTEGFQESYMFIRQVFSQMGPFDGILGFSQGAAMAGLVCGEQWRIGFVPDFRFAILCSGFSLLPKERNRSPIKCPSLHIYGSSEGGDRQIACQASIELASKFDTGCSMVIEHDMGHIIPTQPPYIDQIRTFLSSFLSA